jgi:hypothetical protein
MTLCVKHPMAGPGTAPSAKRVNTLPVKFVKTH